MNQLPEYSFEVTFLFLSIVMLLRYFALAGGFYLFCKHSKIVPLDPGHISQKQIKRDIFWSVQSSFIFAFFGTILIKMWQSGNSKIYLNAHEFGLWYLPVSLALYLFFHETYFYWTHRLLHHYQFKKCHYVHHESRIPTAWTSFSFHPFEALIQAIILPALIFFIPIHWTVLAFFLLIMSFCGVMNHLGFELYASFLEKRFSLISASHHQLHHRQVNVNFGLYFSIWDKWMKTEGENSHE